MDGVGGRTLLHWVVKAFCWLTSVSSWFPGDSCLAAAWAMAASNLAFRTSLVVLRFWISSFSSFVWAVDIKNTAPLCKKIWFSFFWYYKIELTVFELFQQSNPCFSKFLFDAKKTLKFSKCYWSRNWYSWMIPKTKWIIWILNRFVG